MGRNVYLGTRVKDRRGKGLDSPSEFYDIIDAILDDTEEGRIDPATARGRLLLLLRLTYPSKNKKARKIAPSTRKEIRREIRKAMKMVGRLG